MREAPWLLRSCLLYLRELVGDSLSVNAGLFLQRCLKALESFPILILFESRTRLEVLYLLQCVRRHLGDALLDSEELLLLENELWLWFEMSKTRIHSMPYYSLIDGSSARFVSPTESDPMRRSSFSLVDASPLMQLRYDYYLYQRALFFHEATAAHQKQSFVSFTRFLNTTAPSLPVTRIVKSRQSVILIDNSPLCSDNGVLGVMLPFYGSGSFVSERFFRAAGETIGRISVESVAEALRLQDPQALAVLDKVKQTSSWLRYWS